MNCKTETNVIKPISQFWTTILSFFAFGTSKSGLCLNFKSASNGASVLELTRFYENQAQPYSLWLRKTEIEKLIETLGKVLDVDFESAVITDTPDRIFTVEKKSLDTWTFAKLTLRKLTISGGLKPYYLDIPSYRITAFTKALENCVYVWKERELENLDRENTTIPYFIAALVESSLRKVYPRSDANFSYLPGVNPYSPSVIHDQFVYSLFTTGYEALVKEIGQTKIVELFADYAKMLGATNLKLDFSNTEHLKLISSHGNAALFGYDIAGPIDDKPFPNLHYGTPHLEVAKIFVKYINSEQLVMPEPYVIMNKSNHFSK